LHDETGLAYTAELTLGLALPRAEWLREQAGCRRTVLQPRSVISTKADDYANSREDRNLALSPLAPFKVCAVEQALSRFLIGVGWFVPWKCLLVTRVA